MNPEQTCKFDPIAWIESHFELIETDTTAFIYDHMASQSGQCLLEIYQQFDSANAGHWADRGATWDFIHSTGGGRVLDFGPGDGWPSLVIAPYVDKVVGVDGSAKRVEVCTENARRMGITNASFLHVPPGTSLPFPNESFDSVMAASSVENSPSPRATLAEFFRVLRPEGRLRMHYEALQRYHDGQEHDLWLNRNVTGPQQLVIFDRLIEEERVRQVRLTIELTADEVEQVFHQQGVLLDYGGLTEPVLTALGEFISESAECWTTHPSGSTWTRWLSELGFSRILATHGGSAVGRRLLKRLPVSDRPQNLAELDRILRPMIEVATELRAPIEDDPWITAIK